MQVNHYSAVTDIFLNSLFNNILLFGIKRAVAPITSQVLVK